jgi:hypothetical protein
MEKPNFEKKEEGEAKDFILNPDGSLSEGGDMSEQDWDARRER